MKETLALTFGPLMYINTCTHEHAYTESHESYYACKGLGLARFKMGLLIPTQFYNSCCACIHDHLTGHL